MIKINGIDTSMNHDYIDVNNDNAGLDQLYDNFIKAHTYVDTLHKRDLFDYKITKVNMISQIPKPEITDSYYFPQEIQDYVDENASYVIHYSSTIKNRDINLYFTMFDELSDDEIQSVNKCVYMIYMWIFVVNIYAKKSCSNTFTLYTYLTPFKKVLPDNQLISLSTEHVNTAYTSGCRENTEIVIFRKEEWFKVFIHETFHNFGLDFSNMNMRDIDSTLNTIFNVNLEYKLYESYCETWARIINVMFSTYNKIHNHDTIKSHKKKIPKNVDKFKLLFRKYMKNECTHSMTQALKILHFMDLNYKLVTSKTKSAVNVCSHLYKQETAVFTYYIITGLLVNNYIEFMNWCFFNNPSFLLFYKSRDNIESYIELIRISTHDNNIRKNIVKIEKKLLSMGDGSKLTDADRHAMMSLSMSITDNM
jgi:hypothetical protein